MFGNRSKRVIDKRNAPLKANVNCEFICIAFFERNKTIIDPIMTERKGYKYIWSYFNTKINLLELFISKLFNL